MGKVLDALHRLQSVEYDLAEMRRRLKHTNAAVTVQQTRIDELQAQASAVHETLQLRQREAAAVELDLKEREAQIQKLRGALNTAKANKEYATILTQINTYKADNSKLEDDALKLMQAVDQARQQHVQLLQQVEEARKSLDAVVQSSGAEVARLGKLVADLEAKRKEAAAAVPPESLSTFERMAAAREGDVMAKVQVIGRRAPFEYVCDGCNMSIRAEHANALRSKDDIRFCDVCGRILYMEDKPQGSR